MMNEWQPIETAPKMRNILLFAVTDRKEDGSVNNWKMETGFWHSGYDNWYWNDRALDPWDVRSTHWQELPQPSAFATLANASLALGFAACLLFAGACVGVFIAWGA